MYRLGAYGYYPEITPSVETSINGSEVWTIVSLVLALIGGLVIYFLFFKPDKKMPNKYLEWIKDFFNFRAMLIEDIVKIAYLILSIFITLLSFELITESFIAFILMLVLGNLILRVIFELSLVTIMIWKNTNDINKKLKK